VCVSVCEWMCESVLVHCVDERERKCVRRYHSARGVITVNMYALTNSTFTHSVHSCCYSSLHSLTFLPSSIPLSLSLALSLSLSLCLSLPLSRSCPPSHPTHFRLSRPHFGAFYEKTGRIACDYAPVATECNGPENSQISRRYTNVKGYRAFVNVNVCV